MAVYEEIERRLHTYTWDKGAMGEPFTLCLFYKTSEMKEQISTFTKIGV